jgi:hypothetical protein
VSETPVPPSELAALRRAYAALLQPGTPACPTPETLAGGILGELSADERLRLADHVVGCRRCSDDWRILDETHATASPRRSRVRPLALVGAAAAMLLVAMAGVLLVSRGRPAPSEAVRGAAAGARAARDAVSPKSGSRLGTAPSELAWRAPAGSIRQRARLYDAGGRVLWQSEPGNESRVAIPDSVRSTLVNGDYFWTVELETPEGAAKLGPFLFGLERR